MLSVDLNQLELVEEVSALDQRDRLRYAFPLSSAEGTSSSAAVYFELEPGKRLSPHVDSAEEVLVVLEGTVEARVGEDRAVVGPGSLVVVPAMRVHEIVNAGAGVARVLGVFASATVVATFEQPATEGGERVFVVGAPVPLASPLEGP
jgi:quercetin dioxygenase-like cupin family protein